MPHTLRSVTVAIALLGGAGVALAGGDKSTSSSTGSQMQSGTTGQTSGSMSTSGATQASLSLTASQKQTIAQELSDERAAAGEFQASVGTKVPESIGLKPVPMEIANDMPSVKPYSYAKLQDDSIVLADPKDRTVVAVIDESTSTTGSSPAASDDKSGSMRK